MLYIGFTLWLGVQIMQLKRIKYQGMGGLVGYHASLTVCNDISLQMLSWLSSLWERTTFK